MSPLKTKEGVRLCATGLACEPTTSEAVSSSEIGPVVTGGLLETKVWLHGPYVTTGSPVGSEPYSVRTARTRHCTVPLQSGSEWKL